MKLSVVSPIRSYVLIFQLELSIKKKDRRSEVIYAKNPAISVSVYEISIREKRWYLQWFWSRPGRPEIFIITRKALSKMLKLHDIISVLAVC